MPVSPDGAMKLGFCNLVEEKQSNVFILIQSDTYGLSPLC